MSEPNSSADNVMETSNADANILNMNPVESQPPQPKEVDKSEAVLNAREEKVEPVEEPNEDKVEPVEEPNEKPNEDKVEPVEEPNEENNKPVEEAPSVDLPSDLDIQITREMVEDLVRRISDVLGGRHINESNVFNLAFGLMNVTRKLRVSNSLKKVALVTALKTYIKSDNGLPEGVKSSMVNMVDGVVSIAMDAHYADLTGKLKKLFNDNGCKCW